MAQILDRIIAFCYCTGRCQSTTPTTKLYCKIFRNSKRCTLSRLRRAQELTQLNCKIISGNRQNQIHYMGIAHHHNRQLTLRKTNKWMKRSRSTKLLIKRAQARKKPNVITKNMFQTWTKNKSTFMTMKRP